jgi:hypothetical protein
MPLGRLALADWMAERTSSRLMPKRLSAKGETSTRTAGCELPPISTLPTPLTWLRRCCTMLFTAS